MTEKFKGISSDQMESSNKWEHPAYSYIKNDMETQLPIMEEEGKELNPEKMEKMEKVADDMILSLQFNPEKQTFLVITDNKVLNENPELIEAVRGKLDSMTKKNPRAKGNYKIIIAKASHSSATPFGNYIGEKMKDGSPILLLTSMSRSHSRETGQAKRGDAPPEENYREVLEQMKQKKSVHTGINAEKMLSDEKFYEKLQELAKQKASPVLSCTKAANPFEILTKGAAEENIEALRERGDKLRELMKDVTNVHITADNGTDLVLNIRSDKDDVEKGVIKPGEVSNYPMGEWSCSVFWKNANGEWVVNGPFGGKSKEGRWHNLDWVQERGPFKLTLKEGELIAINGKNVNEQRENPENDLIASFINYLDSGNNASNHAFKLAEFALGTNTKACEGKEPKDWGSTETEKKYKTCHIAFGSNGTFGVKETDLNFNSAQIHCDVVCLDPSLTIECEKNDGGKFFIIENGKPQGY